MTSSQRATVPIIALLLAACTPPTIPIGTDTAFYGQIVEGSKFGVSVGEARQTARETLAQMSFGFEGTADCGASAILEKLLSCHSGDVYDLYGVSEATRHGSIYVKVDHERVQAIAWDLRLLPDTTF